MPGARRLGWFSSVPPMWLGSLAQIMGTVWSRCSASAVSMSGWKREGSGCLLPVLECQKTFSWLLRVRACLGPVLFLDCYSDLAGQGPLKATPTASHSTLPGQKWLSSGRLRWMSEVGGRWREGGGRGLSRCHLPQEFPHRRRENPVRSYSQGLTPGH